MTCETPRKKNAHQQAEETNLFCGRNTLRFYKGQLPYSLISELMKCWGDTTSIRKKSIGKLSIHQPSFGQVYSKDVNQSSNAWKPQLLKRLKAHFLGFKLKFVWWAHFLVLRSFLGLLSAVSHFGLWAQFWAVYTSQSSKNIAWARNLAFLTNWQLFFSTWQIDVLDQLTNLSLWCFTNRLMTNQCFTNWRSVV